MKAPDELTDKEIDARREAGLKKLLATPHKPHKPKSIEAKPQRRKSMRAGQPSPRTKKPSKSPES